MQVAKLKVFHVLDMDFGRERVRFVAERNYRRRGPRFDSVEVYLAGEEKHPAKILFFISRKKKTPMRASEIGVESLKGVYAMVQYYDVVTWKHPVVQQPRCRLSNSGDPANYHLLSVDCINAHAHMVPDFDDSEGVHVFWDRVSLTPASAGNGAGAMEL